MEPNPQEPPTEHDAISAYLDQTLDGHPWVLIHHDPHTGTTKLRSNANEQLTAILVTSAYQRLQDLGHIPKPRPRRRRPS